MEGFRAEIRAISWSETETLDKDYHVENGRFVVVAREVPDSN